MNRHATVPRLPTLVGIMAATLLAAPQMAYGQTGNAFFDFEGVDAFGPFGPEGNRGELPFGPERYILQDLGGGIQPGLLIQTAQDGAPAVGSNGPFDDPIGPAGNKSAVWDNNDHFPGTPDGPTNATMGFGSEVWTADASQFTDITIEYDIYLESPPAGGLTFMEHRLGFVDNDGFISTVGDTTARYQFEFDPVEGNRLVYTGFERLLTSAMPLADAVNHVRLDILPNRTHSVTLNGELVEWNTSGGPVSALPWVEPSATGVNEMTFVTNFRSEPAAAQGLVWIDNVRMTNNSLSSENADFDGDGDVDGADLLTWQRGLSAPSPSPSNGDANSDNVVDGDDLAIWRTQFVQAGAIGSLAAIPEPKALLLALMACLGIATAAEVKICRNLSWRSRRGRLVCS